MSFKGKKNIYVCETCKGHIVTVDRDDGVTPFMLRCRATPECTGMMKSSLYRVFDQDIGADHEWFRPDAHSTMLLGRGTQEHVEKGGLILRTVKR